MHATSKSNNQCLQQYGIVDACSDDITVSAALGGQTGSSTRSEALGVIIAISFDGPWNVGIDNNACWLKMAQLRELAEFINIAQDLDSNEVRRLQQILCTKDLRKPWALQKHGDLWKLALKIMIHKGPQSMRFTKVKGHATQEDIW